MRHAEAWLNLPEDRREGRSEVEADTLTPDGIAQAEAAAAQICQQPIAVVFCSPRGRARQTAEVIAARCRARLVELDALQPMAADEPVAAAAQRILGALQSRTEPGNWVVVSHSGLTAALLGEADGVAYEQRVTRERMLPTGGLRRLTWLPDGTWQAN